MRVLHTLLAAGSLFLIGCLPEADHPLSTPATSRLDLRLEGVYAQPNENKSGNAGYWHFHFREAKEGAGKARRAAPWLEILAIGHEGEKGFSTSRRGALVTHLGDRDYLSFIEVNADGAARKDARYGLARYEVNWRGDLRVWLLDNEAIAAAIKSGKLRGKVKIGEWTKDVHITDSTERLAAFVASSDPAKLFDGKPLVLKRLAR